MERLQCLQPLLEECLPSLPSDIIGHILSFDYQPRITIIDTITFQRNRYCFHLLQLDEDPEREYEWISLRDFPHKYIDPNLISLNEGARLHTLKLKPTHLKDLSPFKSAPRFNHTLEKQPFDDFRCILDFFIEIDQGAIVIYALIDFFKHSPTLISAFYLPLHMLLLYRNTIADRLNQFKQENDSLNPTLRSLIENACEIFVNTGGCIIFTNISKAKDYIEFKAISRQEHIQVTSCWFKY